MLVKDHFKRIGWEELLSFDFRADKEEEVPKLMATGSNPFSKKTNFTSLITEEVRNRYLTSN